MAKKATKRKKLGRPTKYLKQYEEQVYKLCLLSATDAQIADFFGTSESTINRWKERYSGFWESIKRGKLQADAEVAESLHGRAVGCSVPEDKVFHNAGAKSKKDQIIIVKGRKHFPPETAAICFWLKNRAGWKDKTEYVMSDKKLSETECENLRALLAERQT